MVGNFQEEMVAQGKLVLGPGRVTGCPYRHEGLSLAESHAHLLLLGIGSSFCETGKLRVTSQFTAKGHQALSDLEDVDEEGAVRKFGLESVPSQDLVLMWDNGLSVVLVQPSVSFLPLRFTPGMSWDRPGLLVRRECLRLFKPQTSEIATEVAPGRLGGDQKGSEVLSSWDHGSFLYGECGSLFQPPQAVTKKWISTMLATSVPRPLLPCWTFAPSRGDSAGKVFGSGYPVLQDSSPLRESRSEFRECDYNKFMSVLDTNKDCEVDFGEVHTVMETPLEKALTTMVTTFHKYSGREGSKLTLSRKELKELIKTELSLAEKMKESSIDNLMKSLDKNSDQEIDFKEYSVFLTTLCMAYNDFFLEDNK
ncbi:hypothetical protein HispidOSU_007368 [Sigmodon hispidus]